MSADVVFRLDLPHGRCVGARVPGTDEQVDLGCLHANERAYLQTLPPVRRPTWFAGRIALHAALADLGLDRGPILATQRGAPELPADVTGSISHKRTLAVALAARRIAGGCVGVDIEPIPPLPASGWDNRPDISSRVMTPAELARLADLPEGLRRREVILHFSLKECLYKALNPLIGRYVSFQEATVEPAADGSVTVALALKGGEGPFRVHGSWAEVEGHLLTTALVEPSS
jgi:4'-phosphopantetheinyl transferase EntD